jgi:hypothetical protein
MTEDYLQSETVKGIAPYPYSSDMLSTKITTQPRDINPGVSFFSII